MSRKSSKIMKVHPNFYSYIKIESKERAMKGTDVTREIAELLTRKRCRLKNGGGGFF